MLLIYLHILFFLAIYVFLLIHVNFMVHWKTVKTTLLEQIIDLLMRATHAISQIWSIVDFNFSSGWLSSITSMVGNMFVSGDEVNLRVEQVRKPRFYLALKDSDPIHCIYLSIWILK